MRICLVQPGIRKRELLYRESPVVRAARKMFNTFSPAKFGGGNRLPPMALMVLAALTPSRHEVFVVDEEIEDVDFDIEVDVVGITVLTANALRGYAIADRFRKRGIKVLIGGIHATVMPEEASQHADAVVIGEAEGIWRHVLSDVEFDRLKPFYQAKNPHSMRNMPTPRRDLLYEQAYLSTNLIQTTRGCPNRCSFCSIHTISGKRFRCRPIPEIVEEIRSFPSRLALFVDDNIVGNPDYAKDLFKALMPLRIRWTAQAALSIAYDDELLKLAAKSGCRFCLTGFESLSEKNIRSVGKTKTNNVSQYRKAIRKIQDVGIGIVGTFILGLDDDDKSVFERTADFIQETKIESPVVGLLTPYPGSRLFTDLENEKRLLHKNWSHYSHTVGRAVFRPRKMTPRELEEGQQFVHKKIFSVKSIAKRVLGANKNILVPVIANNLRKRQIFC